MQEDLVRRFLRTRARADLERLMRSERGRLLAVARRATSDESLAEDAVQEVFVRLLETHTEPEGLRSGIGWLCAHVIEAVRRRRRGETRRRRREVAASELRETAELALTEVELEEVRSAVFELPAPQRAAVELRYFAGLSSEEVGDALRCARRTVDERLAAARERLGRVLAPHALVVVLARLDATSLAPTPIDVPARLAERLDALLAHRSLDVAVAAGAARSSSWLAAAACVLLACGLVAVTPALRSGREALDPLSVVAPATESVAAAAPERREAPVREALQAPRGAAPAMAPKRELRGTALRITVVDGSGALVERGEMRLEAGSLQASLVVLELSLESKLQRFEPLLDPLDLARSNPLEVERLPQQVTGVEWLAYVVPERLGTPQPVSFVLETDRTTDLRIEIAPAREVVAHVVDAERRRPIVEATVVSTTELERRDLSPEQALAGHAPGAARSGRGGEALLEQLGTGEHELEIAATGYRPSQIRLGADARDVEVALEPLRGSAALTITVLDPSGGAVDGVSLECKRPGDALVQRSVSNARGECRFEGLEPGLWTASLELDRWSRLCFERHWKSENGAWQRDVELAAGGEGELVLGFLAGDAVWALHVVDERGRASSKTDVQIVGPVVREARTAANGWVWFEALPEGEWSVEIDGWTLLGAEIARGDVRTDRVVRGKRSLAVSVVEAASGQPIADALILVSGRASRMARADGRGRFTFRDAPPGSYRLSVACPDGRNGELDIDLATTNQATVPIE